MTNYKIPLGSAISGKALRVENASIEKHIKELEKRLHQVEKEVRSFIRDKNTLVSESAKVPDVPYDVLFVGHSRGRQYTMIHTKEGFKVGNRIYPSLSAAAEGVSGVRRSGWTFWCLPDGRTAKEAFGKK